jgi:hypothetical protein
MGMYNTSGGCGLGWNQPLTGISSRNLLRDEGLPKRKADNLTAICELIAYKMWQP